MPWNEPGGNKDPWSKKTNGQGPPDLDELLRKWTGKLGGMFGGRGPSSGGSGPVASGATITIFGAIALLFYIFTGFYIVTEGDRGVELRFGEFVETTDPGWHWHIPWPVEREEIVQFDRVSSVQHKATMLTEDENIVDVELAVQ
ncbi:MAG: protease modulator HflK, partial [Gammaproteobacteria bacterium]